MSPSTLRHWRKNGFEEFYIYSLGNSSFYKHKEAEPVSVLQVQTSRFDKLMISTPDLVVMDCQSGEYKVIAGFGEELQKLSGFALKPVSIQVIKLIKTLMR